MAVNQVSMNGDELINLTNDTVSELSLLSGATAHDASGEQITGKAQYINPNLIINGSLKINQRGLTEYVNEAFGQYTVDMWKSIEWYTTTEVTGTGIVVTSNTEGVLLHVQQLMPYLSLQFGEAYTLSCNNADNIYTATNIINSTADRLEYWNGSFHMVLSYITDIQMWALSLISDNNSVMPLEPHWIKLEPGLIATPYIDPDEALELIKCQRTLQFHTTGDIDPIDLRPTMRITPTVTQMEDGRWMYNAEL